MAGPTRPATLPPGDPRHGTETGYKHCAPPCEDCAATHRANQRRRVAEIRNEVAFNRARVAAGLAPILPPRGTTKRHARKGGN